jgi:hypothetical protein
MIKVREDSHDSDEPEHGQDEEVDRHQHDGEVGGDERDFLHRVVGLRVRKDPALAVPVLVHGTHPSLLERVGHVARGNDVPKVVS